MGLPNNLFRSGKRRRPLTLAGPLRTAVPTSAAHTGVISNNVYGMERLQNT